MKALPGSLLRYKWTFVIVTSVSWAVAAVYYFAADPPWVSEAKLLVRYVVDRDGLDGTEGPNRGDLVMRSEMDLLTSRELAEKLVAEIGADRLASGSGATDPASIMATGLTVENEKGSNVIRLTFRHPEAETARITLEVLLKHYFHEHLKIHRTTASPGIPKEDALRSVALTGSGGGSGNRAAANELVRLDSIPNISLIQEPTPGIQDVTRCNQILAGLYAGGPVLGFLAVMIRSALARRSLPGDGQAGD